MNNNIISFSIPYINQPIKFWEEIKQSFGLEIKEVYFPISNNLVGTGRPFQPDSFLKNFLASQILPVSVLVNPVVLPDQYQNLQKKLLKGIENYISKYNLRGITVCNLELARDIKKYFPQIELTASTLMEISTEQQILMIEDLFDVLVPATKVIRDLNILRKLKKGFHGRIKLIVNESCLPSCVYRTQHFYEMSNPEISYPRSLCITFLAEKPWLRLTGSWILPQHLHFIDGLYDELKLAGRVSLSKPEHYIDVLSAYINQRHIRPNEIGGGPAAVCYPLDVEAEFYKTTLKCDKNCLKCSICANYWNKNVVNYE